MIVLSCIIFAVSLFFVPKTKATLFIIPFLSFLYGMMNIIYMWASYFTGKWVDESVIYHIQYWIDWAGILWEYQLIILCVASLIILIIWTILIYKYIKNRAKTGSKKVKFLFLLLFIASFAIHPLSKNIWELYGMNLSNITQGNQENKEITFDDIYSLPSKKQSHIQWKNIVFIYLESYEKLFSENSLYPNLTPNLDTYKKNSLFFDNIVQSYWAGWTIAGMTASQCWIPLITSGGWGNSMHGINNFLPKAYCMWDFLKGNGYTLSYLGWAKLEFAGKWNFYTTHSFESVEGEQEILKTMNNKNYRHDWWLYDDTLFEKAYEKYDELSKKNQKFWLFLLTLDTHGKDGAISKSCTKRYTKENRIVNSYHCSDFLLGKFIKKIQQHKNAQNTIIVIASDHYAMRHNNSLDKILENETKRRLLFLIIDPNKDHRVISKPWETFDIGATVLSKLWFEVNTLWLWVNLLWETKTLKERKPDIILNNWRKDFESFWKYPSIKSGILFQKNGKSILLEKQSIEIPCLIKLNENMETEKILWNEWDNTTELDENIASARNALFIQKCKKWGKYCIKYINKNWNMREESVSKNAQISYKQIQKKVSFREKEK